jgi:hypothetical protein
MGAQGTLVIENNGENGSNIGVLTGFQESPLPHQNIAIVFI